MEKVVEIKEKEGVKEEIEIDRGNRILAILKDEKVEEIICDVVIE